MHLGVAQIDWVSFLIECEPDLFQTHYLEEWNMLLVARLPAWAQSKQTRVHALGATTNGKRRYVLSLWGETAQQAMVLPFCKWADHLTRVDIKRRLYDIRPDTYERLCVCLQFAETRRNVEAFKLGKRTKNQQRDSGGEGVRFGSRKSDISTKLSKRGKEIPYFETQIQDDLLSQVLADVMMQVEEGLPEDYAWNALCERLDAFQERHINHWLFAAGIDKPINGLRHEDLPMPNKLVSLFQNELWSNPGETAPTEDIATGTEGKPASDKE